MPDSTPNPSPGILSVLEEELNRIVLDVHDGPVQNLFAALSLLTQIQHEMKTSSTDSTPLAAQIKQVADIVEASLHEIKSFLGTFRSPGFHERPLDKLFRSLIMQHEDWTGQVIDLELQNVPEQVPLPIKIALYRILQEALSNGSRHSGTDYQHVKVWRDREHICLQVQDKGKGFTPPDLSQIPEREYEAHLGLLGMRERVTLVGGVFELSSQPGQGTCIVVKVPLYE